MSELAASLSISLAETEEQIERCFPVMQQLRPHLVERDFVQRVRAQQGSGYRLVSAASQQVLAVAGFRILHNLAWGRFLYIDDLVTDSAHRSTGVGRALLNWLRNYAHQMGCAELHLDSGYQRQEAHRFYRREGVEATGLHFAVSLDDRTAE